jgi:HD-GYP domain-containing protein (c-di-GMP phosphodiesterase class II)
MEATGIPKDDQGRVLVDLYVHLPTASKYIKYIQAGELIEPEKLEAIQRHPVPNFFRLEEATPLTAEAVQAVVEPPKVDPEGFNKEVLGESLKEEMKDLFKVFKSGDLPSGEVLKRFEGMTDKLVATIAPEVKSLNNFLKNQEKYLKLMNDSAAISTLAIMAAYANGFDSKKVYRDLSYATVVMDVGLSDVPEEEILQYYKDRTQLPPDRLKFIQNHPVRSHQLAQEKLKSLSDMTLQLILNHHELYNGKGYPRGVRTETLFPVSRVLSLAVDVFEYVKQAELNGEKKSLLEIVGVLKNDGGEAHMRRHNKKLVDSFHTFLANEGAASPGSPTI